jgi:hypothetical protein
MLENWQLAVVLVILVITIWNLFRFGLGMKDGALHSYGVKVFLDNDVDVVLSSLGLLLIGAGMGATGVYANFAKDLSQLPNKLTGQQQ